MLWFENENRAKNREKTVVFALSTDDIGDLEVKRGKVVSNDL